MKLIITPTAARQLTDRKMPQRDRERLMTKIAEFAADPFASHPWARTLTGRTDAVRIRQGDYRAVCRIDQTTDEVIVDAVLNRKEAYRR
jgi:mRNA-degrading endonuclease RelE of RelBE toxin-antitoxin system